MTSPVRIETDIGAQYHAPRRDEGNDSRGREFLRLVNSLSPTQKRELMREMMVMATKNIAAAESGEGDE